MRFGGISVMGSYHEKNQDMFLAEKLGSGVLIVVSDGVGSCSYSEIGSKAACYAVRNTIDRLNGVPLSDDDMDVFFEQIHNEWIDIVKKNVPDNVQICDCYATVLFCFYSPEVTLLSRLGDGFAGVKTENDVIILIDEKIQRMMNETDCLYEDFFPQDWEYARINEPVLGAVCCSDGASPFVYEENECEDYTNELVKAYSQSTTEEIKNDICRWLPKFGGCDDKTIAFMFI